jgi:hypothetical protein
MPPPADRTALLRAKAATLVARIEHGPGVTSPAERQAAAANRGLNGPAAAYVALVHGEATAIRDHHVQSLQPAMSEDAIFELTVAAATGAGMARLARVQALLAGNPTLPEVP